MAKAKNQESSGIIGMFSGVFVGLLLQCAILCIAQCFSFSYDSAFIIHFLILFLLADFLSEDSCISKIIKKCIGINIKIHPENICCSSACFSLGFSAFVVITLIAGQVKIPELISEIGRDIRNFLPILRNTSAKDIIIAVVGLIFSILLTEYSNQISQFNLLKKTKIKHKKSKAKPKGKKRKPRSKRRN